MIVEVIKNLYLGTISENKRFKGAKLCVLEHDEWDRTLIDPYTIVLPIIKTKNLKNSPKFYRDIADYRNLEIGFYIIDKYLSNDLPILVHCEKGRERSPLMIMYYLYKKEGLSLLEAYKKVKILKPNIANRLYWIDLNKLSDENEEIKILNK